MIDEPKLNLVTPSGTKPLTSKQFRALCANPSTQEFTVTGVSRRWLYDIIATAPGFWGTFEHPASKGLDPRRGKLWIVRRKKPTSDRGILVTSVREAMRDLTDAIEALLLNLRNEEELGEMSEGPLSLEDFAEDMSDMAAGVTTFAGLLGKREAEAGAEEKHGEGEEA